MKEPQNINEKVLKTETKKTSDKRKISHIPDGQNKYYEMVKLTKLRYRFSSATLIKILMLFYMEKCQRINMCRRSFEPVYPSHSSPAQINPHEYSWQPLSP